MTELKFTAKAVKAIEKGTGKMIAMSVGDLRLETIEMFLQFCLFNEDGERALKDKTVEEVEEFTGSYVAERGLDVIMLEITEALVASGFLPKTTPVADLRREIEAADQRTDVVSG
ncbi:hypothetical protein FWH13_01525 [Candidatus Saccharibacteria bacterium]|nr:hypothetical protein [Candidatus Saccharibacteria bacterium]